jgi:hypothetical protein
MPFTLFQCMIKFLCLVGNGAKDSKFARLEVSRIKRNCGKPLNCVGLRPEVTRNIREPLGFCSAPC